MGTELDCFSESSHTLSPETGPEQRAHRLRLKALMERHGFANSPKEWWHFTQVGEPFPATYFDIPIRLREITEASPSSDRSNAGR